MAQIVINKGYSSERRIDAERVEHHDTFSNFFDAEGQPLLTLRKDDIKTLEWEWDSQSD